MMRLRLLLSYDGTGYKGWQKQKTTSLTIQHQVEKALSQIVNQKISIIGSGRTDAGVHALGQTAHCDIPKIPNTSSLIKSLNALTPDDISCHQIWEAPDRFHAQISAQKRTYTYLIWNTKTPNALNRNFGHWYPQRMNLKNLQEMAEFLVGKKDFTSFQNKGSVVESTVKHIHQCRWFHIRSGCLAFQICGNSFLKQMVRNLVGTQLALMNRPQSTRLLKEILNAQDRKRAFKTAPAQGLFLNHVSYPPSLDKKCQKL